MRRHLIGKVFFFSTFFFFLFFSCHLLASFHTVCTVCLDTLRILFAIWDLHIEKFFIYIP